MKNRRDIDALFPATCIPALAAWQGSRDRFADLEGVLVEADPENDERVRLSAGDGHNLLRLTVTGRCKGGPFAFRLPPGMVDICRRRPPIPMWAEGMDYHVGVPEWQQPGRVLVMGGRYDPDPSNLSGLMAFVGTAEPCPDDHELGLGGWTAVEFNDTVESFFRNVPDLTQDVTESITTPIAPIAFEKLAALRCLELDDVEIAQGQSYHLWRLGRSWAATSFLAEQEPRGLMAPAKVVA